jgi:hypothetical protein
MPENAPITQETLPVKWTLNSLLSVLQAQDECLVELSD